MGFLNFFSLVLSFIFVFVIQSFLFFVEAQAISWSGRYNIEGHYIKNPEFKSEDQKTKSYLIHHFNLKPKIVLSDGLILSSRLDFLNSHHNNYFGSLLGSCGNGDEEGFICSESSSNAFKISSVYLTFIHEFGALVIGRVPIHFGLGVTYNSGEGFFDHWMDTRNIIGYKIKTNRFLFFPMVSKVIEGLINEKDDFESLLFQVEYMNEDTSLNLGLLFEHEFNYVKNENETTGVKNHGVNKLNLYVSKSISEHKLEIEAAFSWGKSGYSFLIEDSNSSPYKDKNLNSFSTVPYYYHASSSLFGTALEYQWKPEKYPKWNMSFWGGAAGSVSTDSRIESYLFSRNYDVAFLLFNHPMGEKDFFETSHFNHKSNDQYVNSRSKRVDDEFLTNAIYFSPRFSYKIHKKWSITGIFTQAWMWKNKIQKNGKKNLGFEFDLNLQYQYRKHAIWKTEVGVLFPGRGFTPSREFDPKKLSVSYGFNTKISILF